MLKLNKLLFIYKLAFLPLFLFAQTEQAIFVEYEYREKIDPKSIKVNGVPKDKIEEEQKKFAEEINAMVHFYELKSIKNESTFVFRAKLANDQEENYWTYGNEGKVFYVNLNEMKSYEEVDYPKKYVIVDPIKTLDWKFTREKKDICGYKSIKATYNYKDSIKVEAWYAPNLEYRTGPLSYNQLPGLILELKETTFNENEGESIQMFKCLKTKFLKKSKSIRQPNKGELITTKEIELVWKELERKRKEANANKVDTSD